MEYILFLSLLFLWILDLKYNNFKLIKPSSFYLSMLLFASMVYLTAFSNWNVNLSFYGYGIIICGYVAFWAGENIAIKSKLVGGNKLGVSLNNKIKEEYYLNRIVIAFSFIIIAATYYLSYNHLILLASVMNVSEDSDFLLGAARNALSVGEKTGPLLGLMQIYASSFSFFTLIIFLYNYIICGHKTYVYFALSVFALLPSLFWGARISLVKYVLYLASIPLLFLQIKTNWRYHIKFKTFLNLGGLFIIFMAIFLFLGIFTGKVDIDNFINVIQVYIASPIHGVDTLLENETVAYESVPGQYMFSILYDLLYRLRIISSSYYSFYPFYYAGSLQTNIYGAIGDWYFVGGIIGVLVGEFIVGAFFGIFYSYIKNMKPALNMYLILYCYLSYVFLNRVVAEGLFNMLFHFSFTISLLYFFMFIRALKHNSLTSSES